MIRIATRIPIDAEWLQPADNQIRHCQAAAQPHRAEGTGCNFAFIIHFQLQPMVRNAAALRGAV